MSTSQWMLANTSLNGKRFSFQGYEFQVAIADDMHPNMSVRKPSQIGLALALDTPVPTPTGWTTMGELKVGDVVYDEKGQPTRVEYVSPIYTDHECYRLTFDDGEQIVADANHRWYVECDKAFDENGLYTKSGRIPLASKFTRTGVVRTSMLFRCFKKGGRNLFAIPNTKSLEADYVKLPVSPYFLGCWLGDGNLHASVLTAHFSDAGFLADALRKEGMVCDLSSEKGDVFQLRVGLPDNPSWTDGSLPSRLKDLGLLGQKKFIPPQYMRAHASARRDLLAGLLDTDGSITNQGRVSFYNTNPHLVRSVEELARSLGFKTHTRWRMSKPSTLKNGHVITPQLPVAEVSFVAYSDTPVFKLPRKLKRLGKREHGRASEAMRRRIVNVEPVPSVPVRCISVSSPSHLFLAGRGMIPTHNTEIQIRKFLAFLARNRGVKGIFSLPNEKMFKRISKTRIKPLIQGERAFNSLNDDKASTSMDLYEINGSFGFITGMTEGDATSIDADMLAHDEVDLSDQQMIGLYQSRIQNSKWRITHKFSTPTHPDYGIDASYNVSDQHEYLCRCDACNHWSIPKFDLRHIRLDGYHGAGKLDELTPDELGHINFAESFVMCERCSAPLDVLNPANREWVAKFPGRKTRGYCVRPFMTRSLMPEYICTQLIQMRTLDNLRGWYNTVLGEAYSDGSNQLTDDVINLVLRGPGTPEVGRGVPVAVGIDVGLMCHLTAGVVDGDVVHPFLFEIVPVGELQTRLQELRARYNIVAGALDRFPYTPTADAVYERSDRLIIPTEYRGAATVNLKMNEFKELSHAQVNRTAAIDRLVRVIRNQQITIHGFGPYREVLLEHLKDMIRIETPEVEATWQKRNGNDHFFHALALLQMAPRIFQVIAASNVDEADNRMMFGFVGVEEKSKNGLILPYRTRSQSNERSLV